MAAKKTDQRILTLIEEVKRRRAEIAAIDHPVWKTNCAFTQVEGDMSKAVNLHVVPDVRTLITIAGFLLARSRDYEIAVSVLGVSVYPQFTWQGFAVNDWLDDITLRIARIQIASKQKELAELEARLNAIITPELRAQIELEAIEETLKGSV